MMAESGDKRKDLHYPAVRKSFLARARGWGSAKEGIRHWRWQRISAIALVPLSLWFVLTLLSMDGLDYGQARAVVRAPLGLCLMGLFLGSLAFHAVLGIEVVIEDYVAGKALRSILLMLARFAVWFLAAAGFAALLTIAFGQ